MRDQARQLVICSALLVVGFAISFGCVKWLRSAGHQPRFYQENFAPAVMMACGYGFTVPAETPPSLTPFLLLQSPTFRCEDLPSDLSPQRVTIHGTWYYLYGTVAAIWRVTGISWTALDGLAAAFGALELLALYGLFRLIVGDWLAIAAAGAVFVAPSNLAQLIMLRDFSKAPFVLGSVWLLAWLILRPMTPRRTIAVAALFGALVGIGYGFRSDLIVMVPFGMVMIAGFLPGQWPASWWRNTGAAGAALLAFVIAGWPPLQGQQTGWCQFHIALLGLTTPRVEQMTVRSPLYAFGDHFLDTLVDLKVGDYADRVLTEPPPLLCSADYDRTSGELFTRMATTFPADLVVHAYGSVVTILRNAFPFGTLERALAFVPGAFVVARPIDAFLGPAAVTAAAGVAWAAAPRLGIALTIFILFLTGYPAIAFEPRHWFHLRFIPLWALLLVWVAWRQRADWPDRAHLRRSLCAVAATVGVMVAALWGIRAVQWSRVSTLVDAYAAAPVETIATNRRSASVLQLDWQPRIYSTPPERRSSELLAITVAPDGCGSTGPVELRMLYDAAFPSHDLTSRMRVFRASGGPTRVYYPVFTFAIGDIEYLKFRAIEVIAQDADCITEVARVADRGALPLWLQLQVPANRTEWFYHQRLQTFLRRFE